LLRFRAVQRRTVIIVVEASSGRHDRQAGALEGRMDVLGSVVHRERLAGGDGKSGSLLERVVLGDGTRLILKHVSPSWDWIMRATEDRGRIAELAGSGVFDRVPVAIEHAVIEVRPEGGGWVVVMRDVAASLVRDDQRVSRARSRLILAAAAELHAAFAGEPPLALCSLADRYRFLSPGTAAAERGGPDPVPALIGKGWDRFNELAPREIAGAVAASHREPEQLEAALGAYPSTLIHGDLKLGNLGFLPGRVVMLDWGTQTGWAPPAVEWAWYLAINASRIDATREQLLEDAAAASGPGHDPEALQLALLGGLVQLGWDKALQAVEDPDPARRAWEADDLRWWIDQARLALETWSPL
jgi:Phosphotransferase enzyme family